MKISTLSAAEVQAWLSQFGSSASSERELLELIAVLPSWVDRFNDGRRFESFVWSAGEAFRHVLKRCRGLRKSGSLWAAIEGVCREPKFGKGRETFVMLLGQYGGTERLPVLAALVNDPVVCGHAMYSWRLLGAKGAEAKAEELVDSHVAWIRNEAKKYLAKVRC